MRSVEEVHEVRNLLDRGLNDCEIARRTGIPRGTIKDWRHGKWPRRHRGATAGCPRCGHPKHEFDAPAVAYAYLLGLYLGDGCLSENRRGVFRLRVVLDERYPGIIESCAQAIEDVIGKPAAYVPAPGCVHISSYSKQWPCLFPQHGAGPKHLRPIVLVDWQQQIVDARPEPLLRGLIHSDGCRGMNTVTVRGKTYAYPRYTFCNASDDIRRIFCDACDAIGVDWRVMNARNISVAKRAAVARLDEFIGAKR